jgi:hypothetical protein
LHGKIDRFVHIHAVQARLVATVIENLEDLSVDEVIEQFDVTREQVTAVLEFVAHSLRTADAPAGARPL